MIYISGKITGCTNYKEKFKRAKEKLEKAYPNEKIINPAEIILPDCCNFADLIKIRILILDKADSIYYIDDWEKSADTCFEHDFAVKAELKVIKYVEPKSEKKVQLSEAEMELYNKLFG